MPSGLTTDSAGDVYVASTGDDTIRMVTPAGVTTLAGTAQSAGSADGSGAAARFSAPAAITIDAAGNLYVCDSDNNTIRKITPAGSQDHPRGSGHHYRGCSRRDRLHGPARCRECSTRKLQEWQ